MREYDKDLALSLLSDAKQTAEEELEKIYPEKEEGSAARLHEAMRYSLLSGGKRIRAALLIETCRMLGGKTEAALPFACAVEMIHAYSLIHDDLPSMDNDELRRGKPTCHKVYGEACAILAGDGLLTDAFSVCAMNPCVSGDCSAAAVAILSGAAGSYGMVKGQMSDLYGEENSLNINELVELHMGKTGAMICASVQLGCLAAGYAPNDEIVEKLTLFAQNIGLVFQIVDDILDVTSDEETLGKPIGSDSANQKSTYVSLMGLEESAAFAEKLTEEAKAALNIFGSEGEFLAELADKLLNRKN